MTLPLLAPGVIAAAALAFALSIDDFVVSNFNSGTTVTFPLYIFGASQRGIPVEVNVLSTMLFAVAVAALCARALAAAPGRAAQPAAARRRSGAGDGLTLGLAGGLDDAGRGELAELVGVEAEALGQDVGGVLAQLLRGGQPVRVELARAASA